MSAPSAAAASVAASCPVAAPSSPIRVGVAGCTGVVGQRFLDLLRSHPWFEVVAVSASDRSAGRPYGEVASWRLNSDVPESVARLIILPTTVAAFQAARVAVVFSALDASVAGEFEEDLARGGIKVFSNARNHRYDSRVPILIPHANPEHIAIVPSQQRAQGYTSGGYIVTNANCSSTGLVVALRPLQDAFGLESLFVTTMQAISGAGYPGVSSLDITDNVVPYISGEEDKMEMEPQKILGSIGADSSSSSDSPPILLPAEFRVSAQCNRVHVIDGHMECVSVKLSKPATVEEVEAAMRNYLSEGQRAAHTRCDATRRTSGSDPSQPAEPHSLLILPSLSFSHLSVFCSAQLLRLPSAPTRPLFVHSTANRPQPRLDRDREGGFVVTVGRVRTCPLLDFKFALCSHNTVLGAAGGSILNAELAFAKGLI